MNNRHIQRDTQLPSMRRGVGGGANRFRPGERPRNTKRTVRRIIKVYMRQKFAILFAVALTVVTTGKTFSIPYYKGKAYNAFDIAANTLNPLLVEFWLLLGCFIFQTGLWAHKSVMMLRVSQYWCTLRKGF